MIACSPWPHRRPPLPRPRRDLAPPRLAGLRGRCEHGGGQVELRRPALVYPPPCRRVQRPQKQAAGGRAAEGRTFVGCQLASGTNLLSYVTVPIWESTRQQAPQRPHAPCHAPSSALPATPPAAQRHATQQGQQVQGAVRRCLQAGQLHQFIHQGHPSGLRGCGLEGGGQHSAGRREGVRGSG